MRDTIERIAGGFSVTGIVFLNAYLDLGMGISELILAVSGPLVGLGVVSYKEVCHMSEKVKDTVQGDDSSEDGGYK